MKTSEFINSQIIAIFKQADGGSPVPEMNEHRISNATSQSSAPNSETRTPCCYPPLHARGHLVEFDSHGDTLCQTNLTEAQLDALQALGIGLLVRIGDAASDADHAALDQIVEVH